MATFTVTTTADDIFTGGGNDEAADGDGLSLREAIALANASEGADTIVFAAGGQGLIRLTEGELTISDALTIQGGGLVTITGDRNNDDITSTGDITNVSASGAALLDDNSRIFYASSDLTLDGLTLTGGRTIALNDSGGAIRAQGTLDVIDSVIIGNRTIGQGGDGGGADVKGSLTIENSTFSGNSVSGTSADGGGLAGGADLTIPIPTISGNTASEHGGGAVSIGSVFVENSIILGNTADEDHEIVESTTGFGATGDGLIVFTGQNIVGAKSPPLMLRQKPTAPRRARLETRRRRGGHDPRQWRRRHAEGEWRRRRVPVPGE